MPSRRLMTLGPVKAPNTHTTKAPTTSVEKSNTDIDPVSRGRTTAQVPRMKKMLNTQAPTTLPNASPGCRFTAAITDVTRSGTDPPNPTIVKPMRPSDRPARRAIPDAPSTSQSPPKNSAARLATTLTTAIISCLRLTGSVPDSLFCGDDCS